MIGWRVSRTPILLAVCLITALTFGQQRPADSQQTVAASSPANPAQLPSALEKDKDSDEDQRSHDRVIQGSQRQLPNRRPITTSSIVGLVTNTEARGIGGTRVMIRDASGRIRATMTDADGVFRVLFQRGFWLLLRAAIELRGLASGMWKER